MNKYSKKDFKKAVFALQNGDIIAHSTDTCYGFACDIFNRRALASLYKLKKMAVGKPVSILVADFKMAQEYGFFNKNAKALARKYWPGALTIIVKRKKSLPKFLNPETKTIGIRVPDHKLSLSLAKELGRPITTTRANISGQPSPYSVSDIKKQFKGQTLQPDFIIDSGRLNKNPPSTIVDAEGLSLKIIRQGSIQVSLSND